MLRAGLRAFADLKLELRFELSSLFSTSVVHYLCHGDTRLGKSSKVHLINVKAPYQERPALFYEKKSIVQCLKIMSFYHPGQNEAKKSSEKSSSRKMFRRQDTPRTIDSPPHLRLKSLKSRESNSSLDQPNRFIMPPSISIGKGLRD